MNIKTLFLIILSISSYAQTKWDYREEINKMIDKSVHFASCNSIQNEHDNSYTLTIRYAPKKSTDPSYGSDYEYENSVYLSCNGCVFDSSIFDVSRLNIRFDKFAPIEWRYVGAKGSYDSIFFLNEKRLIKRLKSSNKILIEVFIYGKGDKVIEFDVDNLKWNDL